MLYPKEEFGSTYQIPFEEFYQKGYRAIIFDIDNTLVPHGAPADERAKKLCKELKKLGFQLCLLSNNNTKRVAPFAESLGVNYISKAGKPFKRGYIEAAKLMEMDANQILFIGDQIFTDILGANWVGYYSILVGPIGKNEDFWIFLKRLPEQMDLFFYRRSKNYKGNRPDRKGYENNIPEKYR